MCFSYSIVVGDLKFCNLFYECTPDSGLVSYLCIDNTSGELNGIFDSNLKTCVAFNSSQCVSGEVFKPTQADILDNDDANEGTTEQTTTQAASTTPYVFRTNSTFSCEGRPNGYYESEWCNVFFQCNSGERIDSRCSGSLSHLPDYDLWWVHQNVTYDAERPLRMKGSDGEARCDWPCKTKCHKKVWTEAAADSETLRTYEAVLKVDNGLRPECSAIEGEASFHLAKTTTAKYKASELTVIARVNPIKIILYTAMGLNSTLLR